MSLREALAARSNGAPRRRNPSKNMSLREALASRRNPLVDRSKIRTEVADLRSKFSEARDAYQQHPTAMNRRILERREAALKELKRDLEATSASLGGRRKAPAKKKASAKRKSSAKKASSSRSSTKRASVKSGDATKTAAYKRLRKSASKSRFTRAFNEAFKKAKRSGKSVKSAQSSAVAAGKRAAARRNPAGASAAVAAITANARSGSVASLRSNPKKKRSSSKKRRSSTRKSVPSSSAAIRKHATSSKLYKKLRSSAHKKAFITEFNKAFRTQNAKRGVSEAQAGARAALSAYAKVKASGTSRKAPVKKSTAKRSAAKRSTAKRSTAKRSTAKRSSKRSVSLETAAKKSSLYKKIRSSAKKSAFVKAFKAAHAKVSRKASSPAQAHARAALSAYAQVTKGGTRKNPLRADVARNNPRRKSSSKRSGSSRARGKRLKGGMRKSAMQVLSKYGAYVYRVVINGKVVELKANKSSSVYKSAKKGGLKAVKLTQLRGKKNTPTSLNLRSVYKTVDGRPSKADFQRAINAWAGAIDGGKIRGVSKKDIARTRMNPKNLRKHTVRALANPAPMSESFRTRIMERQNQSRSTMDMVKLGGVGVGAFAGSLYLSNYMSALLGSPALMNVTDEDVKNNSFKHIARETIPTLLTGAVGGFGLYKKFVQKASVPDQYVALCGGLVAGSVTSLLARTIVKGMGRMIPGFAKVSSAAGDSTTLSVGGYVVDNQATNLKGLNDMSRLYGTHGLSRYVQTPRMNGIIRSTPNTGAYVMGEYIPYNSAEQLSGVYKYADGTSVMGDAPRQNPIHPGRISPVGANTQMVPNRAPAVPAGMFDVNFKELREDLELQQPLTQEECDAEGLTEVYANGHQLRILRCTPDVARQVAEANFGSIVGESRVVPGSILVLASMFDSPQAHTLTNTLRLNTAPEIPKGASFPAPGGVFSRVAFSSLFPSVSNGASFQEFGVRVK